MTAYNLIDSCGWLEYFAGSERARFFSGPIQNISNVLVPTIVFYEVYKRIRTQTDEKTAFRAVNLLQQGKVVSMDDELALLAAKYSLEYKIPMADIIIYATAKKYNATIFTQDADFKGLEGVKYFSK
jgi:predicted nucleic acid-binding protein